MIVRDAAISAPDISATQGSLMCADIAQDTGLDISPLFKCSRGGQDSIKRPLDQQPTAIAIRPTRQGFPIFNDLSHPL